MKKIVLFTAIIFAGIQGFAQLTLEGSYEHSGTMIEIEDNVFKFFMMDVPNNQCTILNEDHSSFKNISLSIPSGYFLYDIKFISKYLFNTDDKIELLYVFAKYELINDEYITIYKLKVINEDGSVLLQLDDGAYAEIKEGTDGPKLLTYQYIWNSTYYLIYTKVYQVGGIAKAADRFVEESMLLYPNPAQESIRFTPPSSKLKAAVISDIKGSLVMKTTEIESTNEITIDVNQLKPGIYTISLFGEDGSIISEKFEKK